MSRRDATASKRDALTAMERERIAGCDPVFVTAPGVVRGFDAMYLVHRALYALVSADAAIPYRTSIALAESYDGLAVANAIERDYAENGAPVVARMDRASCHRGADVAAVLARAGTLLLDGPPHHPQYYGQLERQNREHRGWLAAIDADVTDAERMRRCLNELWRRRRNGARRRRHGVRGHRTTSTALHYATKCGRAPIASRA
jgi:hypothetical protein